MSTSESTLTTFKVWGRTYLIDDQCNPVKSDDTDNISSIQIALTNAGYAEELPMLVSDGQQLLANIMRKKIRDNMHKVHRSKIFVKEILNNSESEIPWETEAYWAFWWWSNTI
ncbi:hypothetical protein A3B64_00450 [candidate division WWE3 bacterium RIFCSPLOWO2_01_FULL_37_24]|nr:MAG: hypothetical protein A3B64_00450 [candidate division WWE3 bacterium RIFCSPLOWO2_01_FULL_37_24]